MARKKKKTKPKKTESAGKNTTVVQNVMTVNVDSSGGNEADKALRKLKAPVVN